MIETPKYRKTCPRLPPKRRLPVLPALFFLLLLSPPTLFAGTIEASRYQRIVAKLISNDSANQADFARIALAELAQVYMAEADLARQEASVEGANRAKLLGWTLAVDQYAEQLLEWHEDIVAGVPARLSLDSAQVLTVAMQGQRLILSHPRRDQQVAYEQRVLADFCSQKPCDTAAGGDTELTPIPVSAALVSPVWSFSAQGPVCSYEGVRVQFSSAIDLSLGRSICTQLMQEAHALATEIAWQRLQGVVVDWVGLTVAPTPHRTDHVVQLNASGDSVVVPLPLIYGSAGLLRDISHWLRSVSSRGEPITVNLHAARYKWEACCAGAPAE